jgi:hypothetical protein
MDEDTPRSEVPGSGTGRSETKKGVPLVLLHGGPLVAALSAAFEREVLEAAVSYLFGSEFRLAVSSDGR